MTCPHAPVVFEMHLIDGMIKSDKEATRASIQAEVVVDQQCALIKEHMMVGA